MISLGTDTPIPRRLTPTGYYCPLHSVNCENSSARERRNVAYSTLVAEMAASLSERGFHVEGVDPSEEGIAAAHRTYPTGALNWGRPMKPTHCGLA